MPLVSSIGCADDLLLVRDLSRSEKRLQATDVPAINLTEADVELYLNTVWVPANVTGYQLLIHVFSVKPLQIATFATDLDNRVPPTWWQDQ